ncbi:MULTISPECIES: YtfJ family protein [Glaesserella]|uniref:YtfJ family protein n=1 Tax=Glaesserella australis TaxID=2094024 RepID=A0A328BWL8_9PAST|nr:MULTISPECIES: YtfJ family protein [Glaesserella]AUI65291.1 YtfJ family protein [Glaesserella sp. 15-184]RAL18563.1 YtfJ family protein [Glaesserella australis]
MRKTVLQAGVLGLFFANIAFAHNVQLNQTLPSVAVMQDGELIANGKNVSYRQWQSSSLAGKVRVVHHLAGRSSVKEKNQPLMDAIKSAGFDRSKYQTTTIINADDAIVATGAFVKSSAEDGKLENPHSQVVLDQKSTVKNAWKLKEKESFITVLDKSGKVQFVSEGKLSPAQNQQLIDLVKKLISQ